MTICDTKDGHHFRTAGKEVIYICLCIRKNVEEYACAIRDAYDSGNILKLRVRNGTKYSVPVLQTSKIFCPGPARTTEKHNLVQVPPGPVYVIFGTASVHARGRLNY